jgi:hypothetical protein
MSNKAYQLSLKEAGIVEYMRRHDLTRQQFAAQAGLHYGAFCASLRGDSVPSPATLAAIAVTMACGLDDIAAIREVTP